MGARNPYANGPTGLHPTKKMELLQLIKAGKELDGPNAAVTDAGNASDSDLDFSERTFKVGEYVDCADSVKKWLPAQIIRIEGNRVEVGAADWQPSAPLLAHNPLISLACCLLACRCTMWDGPTNGTKRWMWLTRVSCRSAPKPPPSSALRPKSRFSPNKRIRPNTFCVAQPRFVLRFFAKSRCASGVFVLLPFQSSSFPFSPVPAAGSKV